MAKPNDRTTKGGSDFVWSLKDVSFEVKKGEVLGIIGRNGAGKSTLLKILSKVTAPTTGKIKVNGRIASLLEVGTGFHPELTGRENIFLNGAILGMTKAEIRAKFDEIVDFSGVERYIDTPVKRYSSGMYVRLAFAVAAFLEPEILIVDEVLAVGDAEFQKKCLGRMKDVSVNDGRTVLFVSHNLSAVQALCSRCLYLEYGSTKCIDKTHSVLQAYQSGNKLQTSWAGEDGDDNLIIESTSVFSNTADKLLNSEDIQVVVEFRVLKKLPDVTFSFILMSSFGHPIAKIIYNDYNQLVGFDPGSFSLEFCIPKFNLAIGTYDIKFDIALPFVKKINSENIDISFEVTSNGALGNRFSVENSSQYNSILRPNWFTGIKNTFHK